MGRFHGVHGSSLFLEFCIQKHNAKGLYPSKRKFTANICNRRQRMENMKALERAGIPLEPEKPRRSSQGRQASPPV